MVAKIIDGKLVASLLKEALSQEIAKLQDKPGLAIIQVGDNPASTVYVNKKIKMCKELGIRGEKIALHADIPQEQLIAEVKKQNERKDIHGLLIQMPLPPAMDVNAIVDLIHPDKDVDGFHPMNIGLLSRDEPGFVPGTPKGIIHLLDHYQIPFEGAHVVIVGRSHIVGKPLAQLFINRNATITLCHSHTKDLAGFTSRADILVSAVGKPGLITADMVKKDAIVIDVGTTKVDGKLKGDVDFESVQKIASWITPVPGGVGPMTVGMLMQNTLEAYLLQTS